MSSIPAIHEKPQPADILQIEPPGGGWLQHSSLFPGTDVHPRAGDGDMMITADTEPKTIQVVDQNTGQLIGEHTVVGNPASIDGIELFKGTVLVFSDGIRADTIPWPRRRAGEH